MKKRVLVSGLSLMALGLVAASVASAATEVELKDVAARVAVVPENRPDVELKVAYGTSKLPQIMVHTEGDKLIADGKLKMHGISCRESHSVNVGGFGDIAEADLPVITIKVPMDAKVAVGGAAYGQMAASKTLEFSEGGCGSWTIGDVVGKAEVNIGGSGDVTMRNTGPLEVNIGGSGNLKADHVGNLQGNIGGHGDITLAHIDGNSEINIGGSGNVTASDGMMPRMEVNIAGSGNVRYGGEVKDVEVNIVGSGDVRLKKVTGNVSKTVMGSGNIVIGQ